MKRQLSFLAVIAFMCTAMMSTAEAEAVLCANTPTELKEVCCESYSQTMYDECVLHPPDWYAICSDMTIYNCLNYCWNQGGYYCDLYLGEPSIYQMCYYEYADPSGPCMNQCLGGLAPSTLQGCMNALEAQHVIECTSQMNDNKMYCMAN